MILVEAGDARGRAPDSWFYERRMTRMTRMTVEDFEATDEHGISRKSRSGGVLSCGDCVIVISGDGEWVSGVGCENTKHTKIKKITK